MRFSSLLVCAAACEAATFKLPLVPSPRERNPTQTSQLQVQGGRQKSLWKQPQLDVFPTQRRQQRPRRKGPIGDIENDQFYGSYIHHSTHHHDTQSSSIVSKIPFLNDLTYTIKATIGTPPQPFNLLLSISSPNLIVPSASCADGNGCSGLQRYNASLSTTSSPNPNHSFRVPHSRFDGSAYHSTDVLNLSGAEIKEQDFAQVIVYFPLLEPWGDWDGVLGLGPDLGSSREISNPLQEMSERGMLDRNVFSLRLPRREDEVGELGFGSIDEASYVGELKKLNLVQRTGHLSQNSRWAISAQSLEMGSGFVNLDGYVAFLETEFPFIGLPADVVSMLDRHMGLESKNLWEVPSIDCGKRRQLDNLNITLGGQDFEISPWEYTLEINRGVNDSQGEGKRCVSAFMALSEKGDEEKHIVLGTAFLRTFYSVFDADEKTVSLAKASTQPFQGVKIEKEAKGFWEWFRSEIK